MTSTNFSALHSKPSTIIPNPPHQPYLSFFPPPSCLAFSEHLLFSLVPPLSLHLSYFLSYCALISTCKNTEPTCPSSQLSYKSLPEVLAQFPPLELVLLSIYLYCTTFSRYLLQGKWPGPWGQECRLNVSSNHWHLVWPNALHRGDSSSHSVAFKGLHPFSFTSVTKLHTFCSWDSNSSSSMYRLMIQLTHTCRAHLLRNCCVSLCWVSFSKAENGGEGRQGAWIPLPSKALCAHGYPVQHEVQAGKLVHKNNCQFKI